MKNICFGLIVLVLLAAAGCGESASVTTPTVAAQTPGISVTPMSTQMPEAAPTPAPTATPEVVPDVITLTAYESGEYRGEVVLEEEADMQAVTDAIMEALLKSAAWPAVDMAERQDYLQAYVGYTNDEVCEYYVFEMDGSYCLQGSDAEMYTTIDEETYAALLALTEE